MKTAVQTAAIFMMLILVVALTANQFGNTTSNSELESSLDNATGNTRYDTSRTRLDTTHPC